MFRWVALLWLGGSVTLRAGPIIVDGTALNEHGFSVLSQNVGGWLYMQKALENLAGRVDTTTVARVVVSLGATGGQARNAIESAFNLSALPARGWLLIHVDGESAIDTHLRALSPSTTGILYIPTAGLASGDLTDGELTVINAHANSINNFLNQGGAVFGMGEAPGPGVTPFRWLEVVLPGLAVVNFGTTGIDTPPSLTPAGLSAFPGLSSSDLFFFGLARWHNYFTGDLGGLAVLATAVDNAGITRNLILGGEAGRRVVVPPPGAVCVPVTLPETQPGCVTRDARFWFSHVSAEQPGCATLLEAIEAAGGEVCVGFLKLPVEFRNADNVKDAVDATIEALGFFWRSSRLTGEDGGTQSRGLAGSPLCRERKRLAVELIAAIANNALLGTQPSNCLYSTGTTVTNFPADLIERAGVVLGGEQREPMREMTALLRRFNRSGITNALPSGLVECSALEPRTARAIARDPATQRSCPGVNDSAETAEPVASFPFRRRVNLAGYSDAFPNPPCALGGRDAVWKISPEVGVRGAQFTVETFGSNFDTLVSVWRAQDSFLVPVDCNDDVAPLKQSRLTFSTDGTNTFFIVVEGVAGQYGLLRLTVNSP